LLISNPNTPNILMEGTPVLVLSRKAGEQLVIDDHICITITAIKGDRVKVGIAAPPEVQVDRAEVHKKRQEWAEAGADAIV
jgi:carbon storage regulator